MICDFPEWWEFLAYDSFKYHMNFTEGLKVSAGDRIKVRKEKAGTRDFNQAYEKFQAKQDKKVTRQLPEIVRNKANFQINYW